MHVCVLARTQAITWQSDCCRLGSVFSSTFSNTHCHFLRDFLFISQAVSGSSKTEHHLRPKNDPTSELWTQRFMSIHQQHGKIPGSSCLLAWPIKALTLFASSFLWPSSSPSVLAFPPPLSLIHHPLWRLIGWRWHQGEVTMTPGCSQWRVFIYLQDTVRIPWYSNGCDRTQFYSGWEPKSPLKSLGRLLN